MEFRRVLFRSEGSSLAPEAEETILSGPADEGGEPHEEGEPHEVGEPGAVGEPGEVDEPHEAGYPHQALEPGEVGEPGEVDDAQPEPEAEAAAHDVKHAGNESQEEPSEPRS